MKERPILFNSEMVRAILGGKKTQTRRVIKNLGWLEDREENDESLVEVTRVDGEFHPHWVAYNSDYPNEGSLPPFQCPFGQPGDRLWVRETWQSDNGPDGEQFIAYRASCKGNELNYVSNDGTISAIEILSWRPSIHMPRWASRITLEITNVRVERLQDISEEDALKEGCIAQSNPVVAKGRPHRLMFALLWDEIYGTWDANPWVWVVEFKRLERG